MPESVAVFRIGQLGDTVVALPAITAVRNLYPDSKIILITNRHSGSGFVSSWEVLKETAVFSDVLFYDDAKPLPQKWFALLSLAWKIRRWNPTTLFYLSPFPRYGVQIMRDHMFFHWICGIKHSYG